MAGKLEGHWLGSPVNFLPKRVQDVCRHHFELVEHGSDVSILSEPNIHYALFFYQKPRCQELLMTAIKMCANLHKYLIIIHDGSYENSIGHHESIFGIMDISVDDPSITLIGLCQKLHMSFDKHIFFAQVARKSYFIRKYEQRNARYSALYRTQHYQGNS